MGTIVDRPRETLDAVNILLELAECVPGLLNVVNWAFK